jgi:hypothetical protein
MSALRQPDFSQEYYQPQAQTQATNYRHPLVRKPVKSAKVLNHKAFPTSDSLPSNLKILSLLQKGSFGLAIASMAASIGLYMATVKIPQLWSQEYQHLEDLQLQERQLISINETIKYQLAQEASQDRTLAISKPESAVFISPAKVELKKQPTNRAAELEEVALKYNGLGY